MAELKGNSPPVLFLPQTSAGDLADPELDRIGSDIEDGGLDLSLPFKPIGAYVEDKREMLDQCFRVLGEKKLRKMLPDELKVTLVCLKLISCAEMLTKICAHANKRRLFKSKTDLRRPGGAPAGRLSSSLSEM